MYIYIYVIYKKLILSLKVGQKICPKKVGQEITDELRSPFTTLNNIFERTTSDFFLLNELQHSVLRCVTAQCV